MARLEAEGRGTLKRKVVQLEAATQHNGQVAIAFVNPCKNYPFPRP